MSHTDEPGGPWNRVKAALQRDWEQTKHDLGGQAPDLNQDVHKTLEQASGLRPILPASIPNSEQLENVVTRDYSERHDYPEAEWSGHLETRVAAGYPQECECLRYSFEELYDRAGGLGVEGREQMSKLELIQAIQEREGS